MAAVAVVSRLFDRFWLRTLEREVRAEAGVTSPRALELAGRAALANEAAARTDRPPEPFAHPGSDAVAAELYRESIHWSLLALAEFRAESAGDAESAPGPSSELSRHFDATDRALLGRAAGGDEKVAELRGDLVASYREFAELEAGAQRRLVERLERAAAAMLEPLGTVQRRLERIWLRRVLHVVTVLVLLGAVVLVARQLLIANRRSYDLAVNATWTVSSRYPQGGCESPKQTCVGGENYFFHTLAESDPSVTFDLGKVRHISGIEIDNRLDCCGERAVPLAVAVSRDKKNWTEVARRTTEFTNWHETFATTRARYVKIHVPVPSTMLHLSRVRIYP